MASNRETFKVKVNKFQYLIRKQWYQRRVREPMQAEAAKPYTSSQAVGRVKERQDTLIIEAGNRVYECTGRSGKGSFGVVYKAIERDSNLVVAIKRVLQDPRYKNRELQIMKMIDHPNCVQLVNSFYERSKGDVFLNLVLAYVPKNLYEVCHQFSKMKARMPILHVKVMKIPLKDEDRSSFVQILIDLGRPLQIRSPWSLKHIYCSSFSF
eukprot:TRINITY_DN6504_c1_g2_i14.p1 TRINITY_DN6504_c1_g2~~TRINITY_DN6504_c1_g2_i14.p1  ORF type:complete len:210 (-),score=31.28 TRINITY_DN6504_c1_g2_i14:467-1096(-)